MKIYYNVFGLLYILFLLACICFKIKVKCDAIQFVLFFSPVLLIQFVNVVGNVVTGHANVMSNTKVKDVIGSEVCFESMLYFINCKVFKHSACFQKKALAKQYWICRLTNKGVSQLRSELFQIRRQ